MIGLFFGFGLVPFRSGNRNWAERRDSSSTSLRQAESRVCMQARARERGNANESLGNDRRTGEGQMKRYIQKIQKFFKSEDGPTAVEYAVMLALIVIVCLAAIQAVGQQAQTTFTNINNSLKNANAKATKI